MTNFSKFQVERKPITTKSGRFSTVYAANSVDPKKPTLVLINSYATSIDLYTPQFQDPELTSAVNLIAVGLLGHELEAKINVAGTDQFTFWDQADLVNEVLETLGIDKYFVLGTSQGGFIAARAALRAGPRVLGIIACGSTFAAENSYVEYFQDLCDEFGTRDSNFVVPEPYNKWFIHMGWGNEVDTDLEAFWRDTLVKRYTGLAGQRRLWQITVNLFERDGIKNKLDDLTCPMLILHGEEDVAIAVEKMESQFKWIKNTVDKQLHIIKDGTHYLTQSSPEEVKGFILPFMKKYAN
ncbi:alpha/beta-hydrolase [Meredithblackwellia eburnea MCA 4105]